MRTDDQLEYARMKPDPDPGERGKLRDGPRRIVGEGLRVAVKVEDVAMDVLDDVLDGLKSGCAG